MGGKHTQVFEMLFADFTNNEIKQLYELYGKLYSGLERVEKQKGGKQKWESQ